MHGEGRSLTDLKSLVEEARLVSSEALARIAAMNAMREELSKMKRDLDQRQKNIEVQEKRIKYMKLRLLKLANERQLGDDIKK